MFKEESAWWRRYTVALVFVAVATLLRYSLSSILGERVPFIAYFPAVVASAWFGGLGPGLLSTGLSALGAWYIFMPPTYSFALTHSVSPIEIALFLMAGVLINFLAADLHRTQRRAQTSERNERDQRERLHVTLTSIGDAVIATDARGRVTFMNPVAQSLTGWSLGEAAGRPLDEVFVIINEVTRASVENPVARVIETGAAVGLANNTLLVTRDGQDIPIDDSAAPIRGERGGIAGVVLIFRDITERRRTQMANAYLAAIVESSDDAIVGKTLESVITSWNKGAEKIFGYTAEEAIGRPITILIPPDRQDEERQILERLKRGERIEHFETSRMRKDGTLIDLSLTISPIRDGSGNIIGASKIARDISERKQVEEKLRVAREQLRLVTDNMAAAVTRCSRDLRYRWVSPIYARWLRRAPEEIEGRPILEVIGPEGYQTILLHLERVLSGEKEEYEALVNFQGLGPRWIHAVDVPTYDAAGSVDGWVAVVTDISDRKMAEKEIERRYRDSLKLTETNRALVGTLEFNQVIEVICRAARELTGADGATFALREGEQVRYVAEDAMAPLWKGQHFPIEGCLSGRAMLHDEAIIIEDLHADECLPHEAYRPTFVQSLVMMPVGPGTPVASIGIYWGRQYRANAYEVGLLHSLASAADLALKGARAYEEARQARTQAEQASRIKDEFLATVSHELRTPLNAIIGWTTLLQAGGLDRENIHKALTTIDRNARSQAQLIEDLLEVSRIITGKLRLDVRSVALAPTVEAAIDSVKLAADSKGIRLQSILDPLAGPIFGDSQRLQQVVWNLLSNAIKFTPKGGRVQIVLRRINSHVEIVVSDSGEGIRPEFLPHLFERFSQASSGSTRKHGGLGLGLAIVRHIVELHGGAVHVESEGEGKGATFTVTLPLMAARETIPAVEGGHPTPGHSTFLEFQPVLDGVRVLVVDDEADARDLLSALLKQCAAVVVTAASVATAREILETSRVDMIISDIEMPGEDGYSFIRWVRATEGTREIPAAALTAYARSEDRRRALLEGFQIHMPKPVDPGELIAVVANLTGRLGVGITAE